MYFTALIKPISRSFTRPKVTPCLSELFLSSVGFFQRTHFQERHQKGQSGFRSLIFICAVGMQAVSTSAGSRIVERDLKIIVSQKPVERGPCLFAPVALPRSAIGLRT